MWLGIKLEGYTLRWAEPMGRDLYICLGRCDPLAEKSRGYYRERAGRKLVPLLKDQELSPTSPDHGCRVLAGSKHNLPNGPGNRTASGGPNALGISAFM